MGCGETVRVFLVTTDTRFQMLDRSTYHQVHDNRRDTASINAQSPGNTKNLFRRQIPWALPSACDEPGSSGNRPVVSVNVIASIIEG